MQTQGRGRKICRREHGISHNKLRTGRSRDLGNHYASTGSRYALAAKYVPRRNGPGGVAAPIAATDPQINHLAGSQPGNRAS